MMCRSSEMMHSSPGKHVTWGELITEERSAFGVSKILLGLGCVLAVEIKEVTTVRLLES